ncbi:ABC transporter ATP-binding protein [Actinomadura nitritigenes]|uniref:ABC transporter ATP-binding protein n=1 Tax=Actinomadura nitritigenes TaxID=134602 RepID=UPI003D8FF2BA
MTMTEQAPARAAGTTILEVDEIVRRHRARRGVVQAVSGVSFELRRGETLGLVGESGCGKSTVARSILQLPPPDAGAVRLDGQDLGRLKAAGLREMRRRLQVVLQDPVSALNPRRKIRDIVAEGLVIGGMGGAESRAKVDAALADVGLDPGRFGDRRRHELSGGQCQRVAIARAMVLEPDVLICDEPVASLDVSVQAQVLNLLEEMKSRHHLSMLFISHDLAVVHNFADRVAVMYLGKIVEIGDVDTVYGRPAHPYTRALLDAVPVPDPGVQPPPVSISGEVPSAMNPPSGCRFRTRCPLAEPRCATVPVLREIGPGQKVACHLAEQR